VAMERSPLRRHWFGRGRSHGGGVSVA
jgi:hypothetical protein